MRWPPRSVVYCALALLLYWIGILDAVEKSVTTSRRCAVCRVMLFLMAKQPAPISLRIRSAEATNRARKLLHRLDEDARLQRRVKWLATKAMVSFREMNSVAAPKLQSMYYRDRDRWRADYKLVESILLKISKLGVG